MVPIQYLPVGWIGAESIKALLSRNFGILQVLTCGHLAEPVGPVERTLLEDKSWAETFGNTGRPTNGRWRKSRKQDNHFTPTLQKANEYIVGHPDHV